MLVLKVPDGFVQDSVILKDGSQPELGSVFSIRLLCGHACLGQCVHMYVAKPAHVLGLAIAVHSPRISQRRLVDLCCKLSFSF